MTLAQFTKPSLIIPDLRSRDASAAVAELCSVMQRHIGTKELLPFFNAVITREQLSSTAVAPGIALPHARSQDFGQLCFALGRMAEPVRWFGRGGDLVQVVFLFAVPENEGGNYLRVISGLVKLSQDRMGLERLLQAADSVDLFHILSEVPLRQPRPALVRS